MFDVEGMEEKMCQSIVNFLNECCFPFSSRFKEDIFNKKVVTPLLSPFLRENKYLKQFGNDDESNGSKGRRGTHGRKSDGGLKVVYKEHEQHILHIEVKSPTVISEDQVHHPDFTKLANLMKDEVDLMLKRNFPEDTPVFGILVGGYHATVYVMDLMHTKVYRLFEIGSFFFPHNALDLNRLDDMFDTMIKVNVLMSKSVKRCLKAFRSKSSSGSVPTRRQLYVESFGSPERK
ncbi:hypothetical protein BDF20DRAFT_891656 [Mycotypha africana]|uniref:uncharacterized protein n=1 Tax=Mycotypha africana TaxID=64632 RepID=UPI002300E190|nr:uncharacterized protein BDF20DRAFT_891656 [Mycotypha africana]KAI8970493.1 hypothetical protein BDF20DRAFT_891656 [Mycotypha africana]